MQAATPQQDIDEQVIASSALANDSNGQARSVDQDDNWRPEENEEEEGDSEIARIERRNAQENLAFRERREAESNKENIVEIPESQRTTTAKKRSMYARDPLAAKVSPIHGPSSDNESRESENGSDDDFQLQEEPSNAATQRRLKPATKRPASKPASIQRRSPKKARVLEDTIAHTSDDNADVARDQQETEVPLSQAYETYVRANESAKQNMALGTKPPQKRSAWTGAETDMLHHLITEHGTSWTLLKQHDEVQDKALRARDQVALKDKARNMKMDYLKYVYRFSVFFQ